MLTQESFDKDGFLCYDSAVRSEAKRVFQGESSLQYHGIGAVPTTRYMGRPVLVTMSRRSEKELTR